MFSLVVWMSISSTLLVVTRRNWAASLVISTTLVVIFWASAMICLVSV